MNTPGGCEQSYNSQAAVEIDSRLLVSVSDAPNDKEQLPPTLAAVSPVIKSVGAVLVDGGIYSAAAGSRSQRHGDDETSPPDQGETRALRAAQTNH
jgi:hypothetical protein